MPELRGNKAIEDAAIAWVMELERAAGRVPTDTRHRGAPADIESPPRIIEVKSFGRSNRGFDLWLETRQVEEARTNPDFYVYVVENVAQGDATQFTLKVLGGDRLARLLSRAKEQRYFSVPWPVADYDRTPTSADAEDPGDDEITVPRPGRAPPLPDTSAPEIFERDEKAYLAWLDLHPDGFVLNVLRSRGRSGLKLHRAACRFITVERRPGAYTERDYIKVCSESPDDLRHWAKQEVGQMPTACSCIYAKTVG